YPCSAALLLYLYRVHAPGHSLPFPTRRSSDLTEHKISADIAVPGSDLSWYKMNYTANYYLPLAREWSVRLRTDLGYGDGYGDVEDRKSTRLNSSHVKISYAVFCLKKKKVYRNG